MFCAEVVQNTSSVFFFPQCLLFSLIKSGMLHIPFQVLYVYVTEHAHPS